MLFSTSIYVTGLLLWIGNVAAVSLGNANANDVFYRRDTAIASSAANQPLPSSRPILTRRSIFRRAIETAAEIGHLRTAKAITDAIAVNKAAALAHRNAADVWRLTGHPRAPRRVEMHNERADYIMGTISDHTTLLNNHLSWSKNPADAAANPYEDPLSWVHTSADRAKTSASVAKKSEDQARKYILTKHAGQGRE